MTVPSTTMAAVLGRLGLEDAGLEDPTLMLSQHARALAELTNLRWNAELPEIAEAHTVIHAGMPGRWVVPENDRGTDAILHVHGGGWAVCSVSTHEGAARHIAKACACPVLTFDYRLAPEHPYPAGLNDVLNAWRARDLSRRWSIAGDSAGANLALAAMLALHDQREELPAAALLFYGVYGTDFESDSYTRNAEGPGLTRAKMMRYWDWYAPEAKRNMPTVAPLLATDQQLAALPPLYLNAAEIDPLLSDTEMLVERLCALGRDEDIYDFIPGVIHGFMQMGLVLPEARNAFTRAGEVFQKFTT